MSFPMTPGEARALEDQVCLPYPKIAPRDAQARILGDRVPAGATAYRCPFGHGHWHMAPLPVRLLSLIGVYLRERPDTSERAPA